MIRLAHPYQITPSELTAWAYDPEATLPENANHNVWELMVEVWFRDDKLYCELAADPSCPKRRYFLAVLRYGVWQACRSSRWLGTGTEGIMFGSSRAGLMAGLKGRGQKEKMKRISRAADEIASQAETEAREYARRLIQVVGHYNNPELRELFQRLERFLSEPETIRDPYWSGLPALKG